MSATERKQILRVLKKQKRKRKGGEGNQVSKAVTVDKSHSSNLSTSSVNNDWENWVHLHGKGDKVADDVMSLGKVVGVRYQCETVNSFNLLSKEGRREWRAASACNRVDGEVSESKLTMVNDLVVKSFWGDTLFGYSYQQSIRASGGLVTVWDESRIVVFSSMRLDHVLIIKGKRLLFVCVCGDFNSVRSVDERKGRGDVFRQGDADIFNMFIHDSLLIDLPICGRLFTWYRGDGVSMSRLDRFLLSNKWCEKWPNCVQVAYQRGLSDHVPVLLYTDDTNWGPHFVRDKWGSFSCHGWGGFVLKQKLKMMKASLMVWHQQRCQNLEGRMTEVKNKIAVLDEKGEVATLLEEEEGDANSKKFHGCMSRRRCKNAINFLYVEGVSVDGVHNIRAAVFNHFASHFKVVEANRPAIGCLPFRRLSYGEAGMLTKPFSPEEVKQAVWDCDSFKSPGPDGVNFGFNKEFWDILKDDFLRFMVEFHRNGKLTKGLNSTFIHLIPKVNSPQRLNDFRPISLVGCLYKVLAKVLANRLKSVLGSVVSESQSAFIKGKQILDGILIANEAVVEAKRLNKELLLFKVDFKKAYDSVDLRYLDSVMASMNFPTIWRKWISKCVGTATTSVLVNGCPTEEFPIERGLRQGDPLSPFLFLLAAEGFNVIMNAAVGHKNLAGVQ
ncbi:uncharacterized protein [Medicago truncatula]|uniref:uncharacterized protein n=1 Tax=Medicago truncatula TaxID=3880 RepID=UPI000D2F34E2|nr:uncharacterized protein LOC112416586 [Medicago truncatula]